MYEKLRFPRIRVSQTNGEDVRDRWHNALKNLDAGVALKEEDFHMKVSATRISSICPYDLGAMDEDEVLDRQNTDSAATESNSLRL